MKTKIFNFVLPVFAILLAVGFAFATEANIVSQTAYYNHPILGAQSTTVGDECQPDNANPCTFNGQQLYQEQELATPLKRPI